MILNFGANANSAMADAKDSTSSLSNGSASPSHLFATAQWGFYGTSANASNPFVLTCDPIDNIGCCFYINCNRTDLVNDAIEFFEVITEDDSEVLALRGTSEGVIQVVDKTSGSSVVSATVGGMSANAWTRVDVNIKIAVDGHVFCKVAGVVLLNYQGDTTGLTSSLIKQVNFLGGNAKQGLVTPYWWFANAILTDGEDTLGLEMYQHTLTANSRYAEMNGTFEDVDNIVIDNNTQIVANVYGQTSTFEIDDLPDTLSGYTPVAVGVSARTKTLDTSAVHPVIDDGTNLLQGTGRSTNNAFGAVKAIFDTAADGSAWDESNIASLSVGIKVEAV